MNAYQSIALIYELAQTAVGPEDAKKTVAGIICTVLTELESAQVPVTDENIAKTFSFIAEGFLKAAKRQAA